MRLIIITGTCGAGKSTVRDHLAKRLDPDKFVCIDTDEVGINWWDYAGTDHEEHFSDDCLVEAVRLANGHPHKFRRTLATMAIDKGMPIEQVQQLLGHESVDTTLQYAMVNQANVKQAHHKYIG